VGKVRERTRFSPSIKKNKKKHWGRREKVGSGPTWPDTSKNHNDLLILRVFDRGDLHGRDGGESPLRPPGERGNERGERAAKVSVAKKKGIKKFIIKGSQGAHSREESWNQPKTNLSKKEEVRLGDTERLEKDTVQDKEKHR